MTETTAPKKMLRQGLSARQRTALKKAPPPEQIRTRREGDRELSYLEGWFVIAEANRIFGPEHWDRVTLATACVWQGKLESLHACTYTARVRVCVRAGAYTFVREGSGFGQARADTNGEAHGNALKAAETDATKRALVTLGAPFGLTLYDRDPEPSCRNQKGTEERRRGVSGNADTQREPASLAGADAPGAGTKNAKVTPWIVFGATGATLGAYHDPVLCCSTLRRAIEGASSAPELEAVFAANRRTLARLIAERPDLRSDADVHYSGILATLFQARLKSIASAYEPLIEGSSANPGATV